MHIPQSLEKNIAQFNAPRHEKGEYKEVWYKKG